MELQLWNYTEYKIQNFPKQACSLARHLSAEVFPNLEFQKVIVPTYFSFSMVESSNNTVFSK